MKKLEELVLDVIEKHSAAFAEEFSRAELILPTVRTLYAGLFCGFAIQCCHANDTVRWSPQDSTLLSNL